MASRRLNWLNHDPGLEQAYRSLRHGNRRLGAHQEPNGFARPLEQGESPESIGISRLVVSTHPKRLCSQRDFAFLEVLAPFWPTEPFPDSSAHLCINKLEKTSHAVATVI